MPKFSIILPVRNGGEFVKKCIESILAQTINDFNVVVLDNNSNDGTLEWIKGLNNAKINIYPSEKSLSIEENWQRVLGVPKNEFCTLIGHDDILLPNYLKTMEALIALHPKASLYQTHFDYIDVEGKFIRHCLPMQELQHVHEFLDCHYTQTMDSMGTGYMFRSADYDKLGGIPTHYPDLMFADYELWAKLTAISYKATSSKTCFQYRQHQSLSANTKGKNYVLSFFEYISFLKNISQKNSLLKQALEKHGIKMFYFYGEKITYRLLKTPRNMGSPSVNEFIKTCKKYAAELIPNQTFNPYKKRNIYLAKLMDTHSFSKNLFIKWRTKSSTSKK